MTDEQITEYLCKLFKGSMSTKSNKSSPNILKIFGTVKLTSEEVAKVNKLFK